MPTSVIRAYAIVPISSPTATGCLGLLKKENKLLDDEIAFACKPMGASESGRAGCDPIVQRAGAASTILGYIGLRFLGGGIKDPWDDGVRDRVHVRGDRRHHL
jgi:hypothetical protein